jgi:hypothetical protein
MSTSVVRSIVILLDGRKALQGPDQQVLKWPILLSGSKKTGPGPSPVAKERC